MLEHAHGHVLILSKNSMLADGYRKKYTNILHQSQHNNILFSPITTHSSIIPPITSQNFHFPILSSIHTILSSIHTIIHTYYHPYILSTISTLYQSYQPYILSTIPSSYPRFHPKPPTISPTHVTIWMSSISSNTGTFSSTHFKFSSTSSRDPACSFLRCFTFSLAADPLTT